jgi:hypothetical protein
MAAEKEEVILEFTIDQGDALKEAAALKKSILEIKQEQAELNAEFKKGTVGIDQYASESVQLEKRLKTEQTTYGNLTKAINTNSNSRNALKLQVSKLTQEYDNLNRKTVDGAKRAEQLEKELADLNAQITKTSKSAGLFKDQIGNYPEALKQATTASGGFGEKLADQAKKTEVAGVSVEGLGTKLTQFINPVGAAVGVLSGLSALYVSSAAGAKDFQFATDKLSASFTIARNEFGDFIDSLSGGTAKEGGGILSKLATIFNAAVFGLSSAVQAELVASAKNALKELDIVAIDVQTKRKLFEKQAEDFRRIRDNEEVDLQARLEATKGVEQNLNANLAVRIANQKQIIEQLDLINKLTPSPEIRAEIARANAEISDAQEEITGKLTENVTAQRNLNKLIREEAELTAGVARANQRLGIPAGAVSDRIAPKRPEVKPESPEETAAAQRTQELIRQKQIEVDSTQKLNDDIQKSNEELDKKTVESRKQAVQSKEELNRVIMQNEMDAVAGLLGAASTLANRQGALYKTLASAQVLISGISTGQKAYEAAFTPPTVASPFLAATYVATAALRTAGSLAAINGVQFYTGGWTGPGDKYQVAGVVHADEYVAPKHIVNAPAAQPHIQALERMRLNGYAEGGLVTSAATSTQDQSIAISNAIKNMPAPVLSVKQYSRVSKQVTVKQNLARLNP